MNTKAPAFNLPYSILKKTILCFGIIFLSHIARTQTSAVWSTANFGKYKIGFKSFHEKTTGGENMLINIWYPAATGGTSMTLKDYIVSSSRDKEAPDSTAVNEFKRILELPFLFHLSSIPQNEYNKTIASVTNTYQNAPMLTQKFPLVIAFCEPENYITTFEFFASHGYCVASVVSNLDDVSNDSLYYVQPTKILGAFLNYMIQQPFVDTAHIAAIGHGWGIEAPFFLAMKTSQIKLLINLDGLFLVPVLKLIYHRIIIQHNLRYRCFTLLLLIQDKMKIYTSLMF